MPDTPAKVKHHMHATGAAEALRFTATLTDGHTVWTVRRACDARPPTPHNRDQPGGLRLPSEPIDEDRTCWQEVPQSDALVLAPGQPIRLVMAGGEMARAT